MNYGKLLHRITSRIRQSLELQEILSATVAETRSFLGTDRVKVYRFHPDGSGQVIAEAIANNRLPSLLGLNFPAGDIPPSAREMFIKARQRSIVDVASGKIILSRLDTTGEFTVEDELQPHSGELFQRPVDPCHVQYLTAMGVQSSLVVPIFHQQELWGLLVSHHSEPRAFVEEDLQLVQLVADQVAIAIAQSELLSQSQEQARQEVVINQITSLLHSPRNLPEILQLVLERIVRTIIGSGGRLYLTSHHKTFLPQLYTCGNQPWQPEPEKPRFLEENPFWQKLLGKAEQSFHAANFSSPRVITDLYQEPELESLVPAFQHTHIRGILIIPIQHTQEMLGCLTLFRDEIDTETLWAGYWTKDDRQTRPRQSFQVWRELKKAQSQQWAREDIELIQALSIHLAMAVMQNRLYQEQMRNMELIAARATAEETSRLKTNFLASTSHELRTPLATTLNYLKLLKEGFYDNEEELKKYIQVAYQSTENLVAIINDVLDIAKIEAGRMTVNLASVNLTPLLAEQHDLFILETQRKGISLIIDSQINTVYADKGKLRQVLTNLLSNACKFTQKGEVRIKAIKLPHEPIVEISVTDTGIGIDMSKQDLLFEPFVQADGSIKRQYGGNGLGLAICKRLVELMGGKIWLDSLGEGKGITVTFTLPISNTIKDTEVKFEHSSSRG